MAEIQKIYRGMQNGAETIDKNFAELDGSSVRNTGAESIAGKKTFTEETKFSKIISLDDTEFATLKATNAPTAIISYGRKNGVVFLTGLGNWGDFGTANESLKRGNLPAGFRPPVDWHSGMSGQGGKPLLSVSVAVNGDVMVSSGEVGNGKYGAFSMSYPTGN